MLALNQQLTDTRESLNTAEEDRVVQQAAITGLQAQISQLESERDAAQEALRKQAAAGNAAAETSRRRIETLDREIANLKSETARRDSLIQAGDAQIADLAAARDSLDSTIDGFQRNILSLRGGGAALQNQMEELRMRKDRTIIILAVMLGMAVILAVIGFAIK